MCFERKFTNYFRLSLVFKLKKSDGNISFFEKEIVEQEANV